MPTVVMCWALLVGSLSQQPVPSSTASTSLNFEFFKTNVQPIFLAKRPGHARCISCHAGATAAVFHLQPLSPGSTTWNEEESRKNFEVVKRVADAWQSEEPLAHPPAGRRGRGRFLSQRRQALRLAERPGVANIESMGARTNGEVAAGNGLVKRQQEALTTMTNKHRFAVVLWFWRGWFCARCP